MLTLVKGMLAMESLASWYMATTGELNCVSHCTEPVFLSREMREPVLLSVK
jgi:hypothetical protein